MTNTGRVIFCGNAANKAAELSLDSARCECSDSNQKGAKA